MVASCKDHVILPHENRKFKPHDLKFKFEVTMTIGIAQIVSVPDLNDQPVQNESCFQARR